MTKDRQDHGVRVRNRRASQTQVGALGAAAAGIVGIFPTGNALFAQHQLAVGAEVLDPRFMPAFIVARLLPVNAARVERRFAVDTEKSQVGPSTELVVLHGGLGDALVISDWLAGESEIPLFHTPMPCVDNLLSAVAAFRSEG